MKKFLKSILAISCAAVSVFGLSACGDTSVTDPNGNGVSNIKPESTVLGEPKETTTIPYTERDKAKTISASAEKFAADFASLAYKNYEDSANFAVAPVSVYMALSLAAQCAGGDMQSEILSVLGVSYDQLLNGFSDYYRSLFAEYKYEGKTIGNIDFSNSVWLDYSAALTTKQDCIDTLADKFHCYSYKAGFGEDNEAANAAVREFVKDKTKGLIDKDFQLSNSTLFALINTLYIKDIWDRYGEDLAFTKDTYNFTNYNATKSSAKLLQGYYRSGRVYEGENYKTFFTSTANGNKIKFILPKDGSSVDEIFTAENLAEINSITDYNGIDDVNKVRYHTRCLFPEFTAEYDKDIKSLLKDMGINSMFGFVTCDFSGLTLVPTCCEKVVHATKLKVNKTGMEGAAVTVIGVDASDAGPDFEYEDVYLDFEIDRAFGFILTDRYDNTLFSGVVKNI